MKRTPDISQPNIPPKKNLLRKAIIAFLLAAILIPVTGNILIALLFTRDEVGTIGEWRCEQRGKRIRLDLDRTYRMVAIHDTFPKEPDGEYQWIVWNGKRTVVLGQDTCKVDPSEGPMMYIPDHRGKVNGFEHHMGKSVWGIGMVMNAASFAVYLLFASLWKSQPKKKKRKKA